MTENQYKGEATKLKFNIANVEENEDKKFKLSIYYYSFSSV